MPIFDPPIASPNYPMTRLSMDLRIAVGLQQDELDSLAAIVGAPGHVYLREPLETAGEPGQLNGLIGVHPRTNVSQGQEPGWLHVSLSLAPIRVPKDKKDAKWDDAWTAINALQPTQIFDLTARWVLPAQGTNLAIPLPIPLSHSEILGFSQIRGLRLAQLDPDSDEELYSLIMEQSKDEASVQVFTTLSCQCDRTTFTRGLQRAMEIADFAVSFDQINA